MSGRATDHGNLRQRLGGLMLTVFLCLSLAFSIAAGAQTKDSLLTEYLAAIEGCDIRTKIEECDFILGECDSASLEQTALKVFSHFRDSKMMGDENVAVHVAEKWILPFLDGVSDAAVPQDSTRASVREFVEFNRESLLGAKAPLLPEAGLDSFSSEKPTVLWFFDTDCAKCKLESLKIKDFFSRRNDCVLVSFYVGGDTGKWSEFIKERFAGIGGARHLMDEGDRCGFRKKYSVTATPRMFLIDTDGVIAGRMLDSESLEELLERRKQQRKLSVNEMFYRLVPLRGEEAKKSLEYVIDKYILCENSIFDTPEDTLMTVGFAQIQKELLSKARPGSRIAAIKVRGSLNGGKVKEYRLDRLGRAGGRRKAVRGEGMSRKDWAGECGKTVIVFHTNGCRECEAELEAAKKLSLNVFDIDVDCIQAECPDVFEELLESFDLTVLPLLIETDRSGTVTRRYFSLR